MEYVMQEMLLGELEYVHYWPGTTGWAGATCWLELLVALAITYGVYYHTGLHSSYTVDPCI
jgi:hypothetical protein